MDTFPFDFFAALASNLFLRSALLAGLAASLASGLIGPYIVIKRIVSLSGSIAHAVLGGIGLAAFAQGVLGVTLLTPLAGAVSAGLLSALLMGWIHLKYREREDTAIAVVWAAGMSLGVIFLAITPGYNGELINFLFGNILWVSGGDLLQLLVLDAVIVCSIALLYRRFLAICFDEQQAKLQGLPVSLLYFALLSLVALSVVVLIQIVGAILLIALLAIPAAIASTLTLRLSRLMLLATALSAAFNILGLFLSYEWNWPPGATIALVAVASYILSLVFHKRLARKIGKQIG